MPVFLLLFSFVFIYYITNDTALVEPLLCLCRGTSGGSIYLVKELLLKYALSNNACCTGYGNAIDNFCEQHTQGERWTVLRRLEEKRRYKHNTKKDKGTKKRSRLIVTLGRGKLSFIYYVHTHMLVLVLVLALTQ